MRFSPLLRHGSSSGADLLASFCSQRHDPSPPAVLTSPPPPIPPRHPRIPSREQPPLLAPALSRPSSTRDTQAIDDPDEEPFRSKYAANALLESLDAQLAPLLLPPASGADPAAVAERDALLDVRALVTQRRGAIAVDTEDWAKGEPLLMEARAQLARAGASPSSCRAALLDANNTLGVLWTNRSEPARALTFLRDAETVYDPTRRRADSGDGRRDGDGGGGGSTGTARTAEEEAGYTQTLFYLAQVLGQLGEEEESAAMCGACLRRQIEKKGGVLVSPNEWAQNAAQLAGFYVSKACWATARYCIAAAEKVYGEAFPQWARKHVGGGGGKNDEGERRPGDAGTAGEGEAEEEELDDRVAAVGANIQLAWGKLHLHRLMAARDLFASRGASENGIAAAAKRTAADGDDNRLVVEFPSLRLSDGGATSSTCAAAAVGIVSEGPNEGWIPRDVCIARNVFNAAAPRYRAALSHYRLDGFVTEHCDALLDVSSLHKALAFFEDGNRRRHNTLQRRRVRRIEGVLAQLSADKYPGLYKTLWFEVGEAHRAVLENKIQADRPPLSLSGAARASAEGYGAFIAAYDVPAAASGGDGSAGEEKAAARTRAETEKAKTAAPMKVPDDEERTYLTARFVRARWGARTKKQKNIKNVSS